MKVLLPAALSFALLSPTLAFADDDCRTPMAEWQSREALAAKVTAWGIVTDRLKVDDGCYEVRGRDQDGNLIEMQVDPTTLAPLKLEVDFKPGANPARYLSGAGVAAAGSAPAPRN